MSEDYNLLKLKLELGRIKQEQQAIKIEKLERHEKFYLLIIAILGALLLAPEIANLINK